MGLFRWLLDHILSCVLVLLLVFLVCASYYRFMVVHDYLVSYQGTCDPALNSCFVQCNDDACTDKEYYDNVQKYEPDIYAECGKDITDCAAARQCLPQDGQKCSITYCDPAVGGNTCAAHDDTSASSTTP